MPVRRTQDAAGAGAPTGRNKEISPPTHGFPPEDFGNDSLADCRGVVIPEVFNRAVRPQVFDPLLRKSMGGGYFSVPQWAPAYAIKNAGLEKSLKMMIINTTHEMQAEADRLRLAGRLIGFTPMREFHMRISL